jgi:hypothetical protein
MTEQNPDQLPAPPKLRRTIAVKEPNRVILVRKRRHRRRAGQPVNVVTEPPADIIDEPNA